MPAFSHVRKGAWSPLNLLLRLWLVKDYLGRRKSFSTFDVCLNFSIVELIKSTCAWFFVFRRIYLIWRVVFPLIWALTESFVLLKGTGHLWSFRIVEHSWSIYLLLRASVLILQVLGTILRDTVRLQEHIEGWLVQGWPIMLIVWGWLHRTWDRFIKLHLVFNFSCTKMSCWV